MACLGGISHAHSEAAGLKGANANSAKCILDSPKGHCKPIGNEIAAATDYK